MPTMTATQSTELFRRPPDRMLDVGAGGVAHRRVGTGPDVLFVHGWPVSGATFRSLLPHLVDHVTCHVIDLPGAGSSRFDATTELSVAQHVESVRRVVDLLELDDVAVVGHDSGGLIARHAMVGDARLRSMGLVNTEQSAGLSWRFRSFVAARHLPGTAAALGWAAGNRRVRRNRFVFGSAFSDPAQLDGEFDELFLRPLHESRELRVAAARVFRSFDLSLVHDLGDLHRRIDVPVQLVWGDRDPFFPLPWAQEMVGSFPDARLHVVRGAGLFVHEERPEEVASVLLATLRGDDTER
jgi:pimeloyl-ACP methyl ester carboxylesterase